MVANGLSKLTQATVSAGNCPAAHARRLVWHINARCHRTQSYGGRRGHEVDEKGVEGEEEITHGDKVTRRPCLVAG